MQRYGITVPLAGKSFEAYTPFVRQSMLMRYHCCQRCDHEAVCRYTCW